MQARQGAAIKIMIILATGLGLEIIGRDLRIAAVRATLNKFRLGKCSVISGFLDLSEEDRRRTLSDFVRKQKLFAARVFLTLPHDKGVVRQMEFPVEVKEKLKSAVALQVETLSPWPVNEIYWDVSEEQPTKGARTFSAAVGIVPRDVLDPWISFFKSVGLPLSGAALSSLACAHGVATIWNDSVPTLVAGCETDYVEGALVQGTRLVSITTRGSDTTQTLQSVVERLLSTARVGSPDNVRIIAYGAAAESLGSFVVVRIPIEGAGPDSFKSFGAISAALSAMKRSAFSANFIPPELRFRRSLLQLVPTYVLIAVICLLGIAMLLREPYQYMLYGAVLDDEIRKISTGANQVSLQETALNQLSEKYRALVGHFRVRDMTLESLKELSRILPPTTWLTAFNYQDGSFSISGLAQSASEIQKVVEDSPLFKDVQFTSSVTRDANGQDRFSLKASIEVPK